MMTRQEIKDKILKSAEDRNWGKVNHILYNTVYDRKIIRSAVERKNFSDLSVYIDIIDHTDREKSFKDL